MNRQDRDKSGQLDKQHLVVELTDIAVNREIADSEFELTKLEIADGTHMQTTHPDGTREGAVYHMGELLPHEIYYDLMLRGAVTRPVAVTPAQDQDQHQDRASMIPSQAHSPAALTNWIPFAAAIGIAGVAIFIVYWLIQQFFSARRPPRGG